MRIRRGAVGNTSIAGCTTGAGSGRTWNSSRRSQVQDQVQCSSSRCGSGRRPGVEQSALQTGEAGRDHSVPGGWTAVLRGEIEREGATRGLGMIAAHDGSRSRSRSRSRGVKIDFGVRSSAVAE